MVDPIGPPFFGFVVDSFTKLSCFVEGFFVGNKGTVPDQKVWTNGQRLRLFRSFTKENATRFILFYSLHRWSIWNCVKIYFQHNEWAEEPKAIPLLLRKSPGSSAMARSQIKKTFTGLLYLAPTTGLEPVTSKLTASCSTIELRRNTFDIIYFTL